MNIARYAPIRLLHELSFTTLCFIGTLMCLRYVDMAMLYTINQFVISTPLNIDMFIDQAKEKQKLLTWIITNHREKDGSVTCLTQSIYSRNTKCKNPFSAFRTKTLIFYLMRCLTFPLFGYTHIVYPSSIKPCDSTVHTDFLKNIFRLLGMSMLHMWIQFLYSCKKTQRERKPRAQQSNTSYNT